MSRISNTRLPASAIEWPESASLRFDAFQPLAAYETGTAAGNKRRPCVHDPMCPNPNPSYNANPNPPADTSCRHRNKTTVLLWKARQFQIHRDNECPMSVLAWFGGRMA